ncbi:MAG: Na/Pi cotransporter family protein [Kiritimatiellae bacterium]|nr:Na/Pi cotransporter family protein [Kiritimatiellia bacterium]
MKDLLIVLATVGGGLGLFLLGMKHLSEGLQAVGGDGLRKFMGLATTNKIVGVGTGIISTLIAQSSAIITAMLVGFVSSGMMTLSQAINVIIGANIGTTGTVWLVAFAPSPEVLGMTGLALGGILYFFIRKETPHNLGLAILGIGLALLGLYFMHKGVLPIRNNEAMRNALQSIDVDSLLDVAIVAAGAMILSAMVHSAATIAIAMTLASHGLITYETAIATLFGANIGTTITAWMVAVGGTADAKRTALAHTMSNVVGSILLMPLALPVLVPLGKAIFPNWNVVAETAKGPVLYGIMAPIAVTDTIFSLLRGILTFPVVKPFVRFIEWAIPQPENEKPHLSSLKFGARLSPVIACDQALKEIVFMRESGLDLLQCVERILKGESEGETDENHILHREEILDNVQREVTEFLGSIMTKRLAQDVAARSRRLLRLSDELESVSDEAAAIVRVVRRLRKRNQQISEASQKVLLTIHERVYAYAEKISPWIRSPRPLAFIDPVWAQKESSAIHEFIRKCRSLQLGRVSVDDPESPLRVLGELDILNAYERIRSYYLNIVETLAGGKVRA